MTGQLGKVVVGGGSGFIGTALTKLLQSKGYDVVIISRKPGPWRMTWGDLNKQGLPESTKAVINVAGQNVLDPLRRWSPGFQQNVWASRVNTTKSLAQAIINAKDKPEVFVSMSGVGYYPPSETKEYTELSDGGQGNFFAELCKDWEEASMLPKDINARRAVIRSGVVLGREGGMIAQIFWPFFAGLGGKMGSGDQFFPWIHVEDLTRLILHAIEERDCEGVYNGVAPQVIRNSEFTNAFAKALWRPALFPLPELVLKAMFSPDRAEMITRGQKVIPQRTLVSGFTYKYPDIQSACQACNRAIYID
nr:EOG090X07KR [Lepidurus arcticus]